ncbi:7-carboxy-7-deazaguanine synthase [Thermoflavimicrobium dichotomicum]|uniref:7-carboxy-7-deazaguanine synthase n=2 Tax=Thermoflavimicrobium dichotomicum TaxID=46223 RepID=A0A1I3RQV5_9BACL|nr:7-carboxy-7-deazaguanine synthase [Thermoflavimicrobium dichotomicum]
MTVQTENEQEMKLPMVEIFETVEGEGTRAGFPTTFVRVYNCNLRCTWCDTKYSYAPAKPAFWATIGEIVSQVKKYPHQHICLTGGEPLMHGRKSLALVKALAAIDYVKDIHIETNGAIHLEPFHRLRQTDPLLREKVRFIMDYKLPASGEHDKMIMDNFQYLNERDEIKFVIGNEEDFHTAVTVVKQHVQQGLPLFSPVWETMPPARLVSLMLKHQLSHVKLNVQLHKVIWDPEARGV